MAVGGPAAALLAGASAAVEPSWLTWTLLVLAVAVLAASAAAHRGAARRRDSTTDG
jgi:membrane protein implicated in regulation of membrane protease activity